MTSLPKSTDKKLGLVTDLDMKWVEVVDQYGTEYAVQGRSTEVFAYPFSTVGKRVDRGEHDFMHKVFHAIKQSMSSGEYIERKANEIRSSPV